MAMIYTLATSAKEWLSERFGQGNLDENNEEEETEKDDVWLSVCLLFIFARYLLDRPKFFERIELCNFSLSVMI